MRFQIPDCLPRTSALSLTMLPEVKITSYMRQQARKLYDRFHGDHYGMDTDEGYLNGLRGFRWLGMGSYRRVWRNGDYVFKLSGSAEADDNAWDFRDDTIGGNLAETRFMRQMRDDGWGWFVPSVATIPLDGEASCNVMHYFDVTGENWEAKQSRRGPFKLFFELQELLSWDYHYGDAHAYNLMQRYDNGMPVLVDGGSNL